MSDDEGFMHNNNSDEDDNDLFEEDDLIAFQRSKVAASDLVPFEAENDFINVEQQQQATTVAANSTHLVPYSIVPTQETNAVRPEYAVVDNVAFYNHVSLLALTYGQATQGIKAGAIFDFKEQRMKEQKLQFDF
jgi:hypothetical protein